MTAKYSLGAKSISIWASFLVLLPVFSVADEQEGDAAAGILEEVIVTSSKREVNLGDLAMSVAALTEKQLQELNVLALQDYWSLVPSLSVEDGPLGGYSVVIRGLSDSDSFQTTEAVSAFHMDDTSLTYASSLFATPGSVTLVDINRVEVLRGPQGTLMGANAMGGAIRVISNEPDSGKSYYRIEANLGNTSHGDWNYGAQAVFNFPLGDDSALRLVGFYQNDDGFIDDIGTRRNNINDNVTGGGRIAWSWNAGERVEILARVHAESKSVDGYNYADPIGKASIGLATEGDYQVALLSPEFRDEDLLIAALRLKWQLGWGEFYSASSYYEKTVDQGIDWSKELFYWFDLGFWHPAPFFGNNEQQDLSQEIRLVSDGAGRLNWLVGAYFLDQNFDMQAFGTIPGLLDVCPPCAGLAPDEVILDTAEVHERTDLALFGEVNWQFTESLQGTIGLRWYSIDRTITTVGRYSTFPLDGSVSGDADDVVGKLALSWHANEQTMIYGLVSEGFRPGQFNNPAAQAVCGAREIIDSDNLTNYEVGFKTRSSGNRFGLNASLYHIDWDDMQSNLFVDDCPFIFLENASRATSDGIELEFDWLVSDSFSLLGALGYFDAELSRAYPDPGVNAPAGTRLPNSPDLTANLRARWDFNWNDRIPGYLRADARYVGDKHSRFDQTERPLNPLTLDAYTVINLGLGGSFGRWQAELFVQNLFNEFAEIFCCRFDVDATVLRPRTIGIRATWQ